MHIILFAHFFNSRGGGGGGHESFGLFIHLIRCGFRCAHEKERHVKNHLYYRKYEEDGDVKQSSPSSETGKRR